MTDIMKINGTYERICQKLLSKQPRPQLFGHFSDGHFQIGHKSLHRTDQARKYRMFLRIKQYTPI